MRRFFQVAKKINSVLNFKAEDDITQNMPPSQNTKETKVLKKS